MNPVGYFIMSNDFFKKKFLWTTSLYLFFQAVFTFILLLQLTSKTITIKLTLLIFITTIFIEYIGVFTGFPFGTYSYTDTLKPLLPGGVPIAIGFAWFVIAVNSFIVIKHFLSFKNKYLLIFVSGAIILFIDILLEPFASFINNFWIWNGNEIPFVNYISWFIIGVILSLLLNHLIGAKVKEVKPMYPMIILLLNVSQFTLFDVYYGYLSNSFFGLFGLIAAVLLLKVKRKNEI